LKSFIRNQKAMSKQAAAVLSIIIIVVSIFGLGYAWNQGWIGAPSSNNVNTNPSTGTGGQPSTGSGTVESGPLYASVVDKVTRQAFTTSTVQINQIASDASGVFDFLNGAQMKSLAQAANPQSETQIYTQGQQVIIVVTCTGNPSNGLDYYPVWYYCTLNEGATVYQLDNAACWTQVSASPYKYTINLAAATATDQRVHYTAVSLTNYWNIGDLAIYPRLAAANTDISVAYGATTLASVTDASTWVDTAAEITANCTLASASNEKFVFSMTAGAANLGWGKHFFAFDSDGKIHEYGGVLVVATTDTTMTQPNEWSYFGLKTLTNENAYYKILQPDFPNNGQTKSWSVDIPMNVAADSTKYLMKIWLLDCQNLDTIGTQGTTTSVPQGYGFMDSTTDYGVGAVVHAVGLTISSGASATPQLEFYFTAPS